MCIRDRLYSIVFKSEYVLSFFLFVKQKKKYCTVSYALPLHGNVRIYGATTITVWWVELVVSIITRTSISLWSRETVVPFKEREVQQSVDYSRTVAQFKQPECPWEQTSWITTGQWMENSSYWSLSLCVCTFIMEIWLDETKENWNFNLGPLGGQGDTSKSWFHLPEQVPRSTILHFLCIYLKVDLCNWDCIGVLPIPKAH